MINKWILNNFKSIDEEKELEFRPLTIFTGANSSGKSTILQSILLVTQTLQNQNSSRSVVLNGGIKKFGSYDDIVNLRNIAQNIEIGFQLSIDGLDEDFLSRRLGDDFESVNCNITLSSNGMVENLQPKLQNMKMETFNKKERVGHLELERAIERSEEEKLVIKDIEKEYSNADFDFRVKTDYKVTRYYFQVDEYVRYIGASMFHFLPDYLIGYYSYKEHLKSCIKSLLLSGSSGFYELEPSEVRIVSSLIKEKALEIVDEIYQGGSYKTDIFETHYQMIKKRFTLKKLFTIFRLSTLDGEEKQIYVNQLLELLDNVAQKYRTERVPMYFHSSLMFVRDFYREHIKYLGPLREEPRSLYPLESNESIENVGLRGENTAYVFENNKTRKVTYISSEAFANTGSLGLKPKKRTLAEAVNDWLVYLGVAHDITTNDQGKVGHELKITTDIPMLKQDLTHVGVGVSQVLPILVMSLLAEKGDVIILEQPELHLHPKVQTRLADFFVSMNALGKQCLIETHSEYFINRLRYLVAKSETSKVADDTMIYFVEKDGGHSNYRQITINKYGVIGDWPDGFFDEGEDLATKIMKAGVEKKRREIQSSKS